MTYSSGICLNGASQPNLLAGNSLVFSLHLVRNITRRSKGLLTHCEGSPNMFEVGTLVEIVFAVAVARKAP